ncbi:hypothetical protein COCVIDRAFT_34576 [Bipolaris victoriae FI3]|uniref:NACHT domain-containing protein n=1 Tax=Bipolaris victoriae (strain FI3) TaxID=930091 RepID=W7EJ83_BIPV3|nr:hypothetical protein COCVIDRAFT_34576 [Bipolaris victoriae FI3]
MAEDRIRNQHISGVSTQNGSQAFVGSAQNVYFADHKSSQELLEKAAVQCRDALFVTDPYVDRESLITAKGARVPGTCEWIRNDVNYRVWLNGGGPGGCDSTSERRLLWISGGPGKGKTMLSIFLTEELKKHAAQQENTDLIFFFCSAQNEKHSTALAVLRGLLHQILTKRPQLSKHALRHFEPPERKQQTLASLEALWIIFVEVITDVEFGTMFCVLDGFDECEESTRKVLLSRLVTLLNGHNYSNQNAFKLAIISRDMHGLKGCLRVRLDPDNDERVSSDIELFISARMNDLSEIEGFNEKMHEDVQKELLDRAEGTFLWVGFAIHELSQKRTCSEVLRALRGLPRGLPAIYGHMLLRIPEEQREISRKILRWVTLAIHPLSLQELAAAVGIQSSFPTQITEEQATRDAIFYCKPLLQEQKARNLDDDRPKPQDYHVQPDIRRRNSFQGQEQKEISFVHQSARDYMLRKEKDDNKILEEFRIESKSANLELTKTCLECIIQRHLQKRSSDLLTGFRLRDSHLWRYAVLHWPDHAKSCSAQDVALLDTLQKFLYGYPSIRDHWWMEYNDTKMLLLAERMPLLHMTCYLGIVPLVEAELGQKDGHSGLLEPKTTRGEMPMHYAALAGREEILQLLLDAGADIAATTVWGEKPLHYAAVGGNKEILRLLLDAGAEIDAKNCNGGTVLRIATSASDHDLIELLLDKGADAKAIGAGGWMTLYIPVDGYAG